MNKSQALFVSAIQTAVVLPIDSHEHDLDVAALETFATASFDKLDYPEWRREFNILRQNLVGKAQHKTASERAAAAAAAPKPPGISA